MKETTKFTLIGGQWCAKVPKITSLIIASSQHIKNMMHTCDMFRMPYCQYMIRWYKLGNTATLTINNIRSYDTQRI